MKQQRDRHRTQWAAQFAVASELCKLDYKVAFTLGNHPGVDLMVISPKGRMFKIEVKGVYKPNYWQMRKREALRALFCVFAYVPDGRPNQFFVMRQKTVNLLIDRHARKSRHPLPNQRLGVPWRDAKKHDGKWKILPDYEPPQSKWPTTG